MDEIRELYDRWVSPVYMRFLHGNFRHYLTALIPSDERTQMISEMRRCVAEVDPAVVTTLIRQPDWRARLAGSWYAGLRGWTQFVDELGAMLLKSETCFAGQGYCAALACYADRASTEYLHCYLNTWLPELDKFYDQHWALPALVWIEGERQSEGRLETNYAAEYLSPGGPWDRWAAAHHREGRPFYMDCQRRFDRTLASALAGLRTA